MVRLSAIDSSDTVTSTMLRRGSFIGAVAILVLMTRVLDHVGRKLKHLARPGTTAEQGRSLTARRCFPAWGKSVARPGSRSLSRSTCRPPRFLPGFLWGPVACAAYGWR